MNISATIQSDFHHVITIRNAILVYNLYSMSLAVYVILIKKLTGKRLYSCFNLSSNGILSDSVHIRSIISISLKIAIEAPISFYTNMATVFCFSS